MQTALGQVCAVFRGRFATQILENAVEAADALEAALHGDVRQRRVGVSDQLTGMLEAQDVDEFLEIHLKTAVEEAREIVVLIAQRLRHAFDGDVGGVVIRDVVQNAAWDLGIGTNADGLRVLCALVAHGVEAGLDEIGVRRALVEQVGFEKGFDRIFALKGRKEAFRAGKVRDEVL